ncbi:MAG: Hsp20/alpha crystallin family protein [Anaerolineae bacterium]|jgi:HSP20 family protein
MSSKKHRKERGSQAGAVAQRALGESWVGPQQAHTWAPPTDVYETDAGLVVQVEIAGVATEDLSISLGDGTLVIQGVRRDLEPKRVYYQMEIRCGSFRSEILLPWAVKSDDVEATYEQGLLRVFIPRPVAHRVPVSSAERDR